MGLRIQCRPSDQPGGLVDEPRLLAEMERIARIYEYTKAITDAINIGVVLFPSVKNDFPAPYRVSAQTLNRLADR